MHQEESTDQTSNVSSESAGNTTERDPNENDVLSWIVHAIIDLKNEVREMREDLLINSWVNGSRLEPLETTMENLVETLNKIVSLVS